MTTEARRKQRSQSLLIDPIPRQKSCGTRILCVLRSLCASVVCKARMWVNPGFRVQSEVRSSNHAGGLHDHGGTEKTEGTEFFEQPNTTLKTCGTRILCVLRSLCASVVCKARMWFNVGFRVQSEVRSSNHAGGFHDHGGTEKTEVTEFLRTQYHLKNMQRGTTILCVLRSLCASVV